jgi:hypothetical protein
MLESSRRTPRELLSERGVLADDVVAVEVDGRIVDLHAPVDPAAQLRPIRNARLMRHAYIGVLGDKEAESETVSLRSREAGDLGSLSLAEFRDRLVAEAEPPRFGRLRHENDTHAS